ncbi:MAG: clostripain [Spirochaetes bacterium]|nr:clostripain [Spirochaetota bacterium]
MKRTVYFLIILLLSFLILGCSPSVIEIQLLNAYNPEPVYTYPKDLSDWTFIYYSNADNNLEREMLSDVEEMKSGLVGGENISLVMLIDRYGVIKNESVFGEDFGDTRLYEIQRGKTIRLEGFEYFTEINKTSSVELNMGDATNLKRLIQYSKKYFPANKYALFIANHGNGIKDNIEIYKNRSISYDDTNRDFIALGEFTDVLTSAESVDLLALDACLMGYIEIAYQFSPITGVDKFSAEYFLASTPVEWSNGFEYDKIFSRFKTTEVSGDETDALFGGNELFYSPKTMTGIDIGKVILEEQKDALENSGFYDHSYILLDLKKTEQVKESIDDISHSVYAKSAKLALESIKGNYPNPSINYYFYKYSTSEWADYSSFDIYDLILKMKSNPVFDDLSSDINLCLTMLDELILSSYGGSEFDNYVSGKNGLTIFFPAGDKPYYTSKYWNYQIWYNPLDASEFSNYYGKILWCQDNATRDNGIVENWFELLDYFYDDKTRNGGESINYYNY